MRNLILFIICSALLLTHKLIAQNAVTVKFNGLKSGDTCTVQLQKSLENFYFKKIGGTSTGTTEHTFSNLSNGKWALKLDATGYFFPSTQVFELDGSPKSVTVTLTPIALTNSTNFVFKWEDDLSNMGHAQQSYINEPNDILVIDQTIKVPDDFNSITLLNKYGIALSDKVTPWTPEDAFRLFQTVKRISSLSINDNWLAVFKADVKSVWYITDQEVIDDIKIVERNSVKFVTISRKAFTYASPLVVTLDGVKGRFYSKRLYGALVNYATNYGFDKSAVDQLALNRFGIRFLIPNDELRKIMNEDFSNFQEFSAFEKITILSMLEELPDGMHIQDNLKYLVRRIAGQLNPKYPGAPAIAWIGSKTIEFMQIAFTSNQYSYVQRLVLHEKSHFMWDSLFEQKLRDDWTSIGGWFLDPTSPTGWSTSNTTEFVSAYAHLKNPNEDMAESIAAYVVNPEILRSRSLKKFEFIRDRIMQGTRYISIIRKDLTFQVYNLFPDYNYPGKIKKVDVQVNGLPTEDKELVIRIELNKIDEKQDGASSGLTRLTSSIGTFFDLFFNPVDNGNGFILEGRTKLTKFAKSGYYCLNQIRLTDKVGNERFENNNTFGIKIFVNNPLEDLLAPKYIDKTIKLSLGSGKFSRSIPSEDPSGDTYQAIQSNFDVLEKNKLDYVALHFAIPKNDEKGVKQSFWFGVLGSDPNYINKERSNVNINKITYKYPIPEYYPSGYYLVSQILVKDEAQNSGSAYFMNDTTSFKLTPNVTKHLRDSLYVKTKYPDFVPPILDLNQISINATPSNPSAPDGETLFEMDFFAKDSSSYINQEAGINNGSYTLRDPQGKTFTFQMYGDLDKQFKTQVFYTLKDPIGKPSDWRKYRVSVILPKGSAPGLWGVESITLTDRAFNTKNFNFTEIVRFDLEKADSTKLVQPKVEILGKKVNAKNVQSLSLSISCKDCKNKNFRARFYSNLGGNSIVSEGKMSKDSIVVENINLTSVNDGILYATVYILDSTKTLLGIGKSIYAKDISGPLINLSKTSSTNGKLVLNLRSNEYISNNLSVTDLLVKNGIINSTRKIDNKNFEININRSCTDSLSITLLAGKLLDTVGNTNQSVNLNLLDLQKPATPAISVSNSQNLTTSENGSYQWYLDNKIILGATQKNFVATQSGSYTLIVTNIQGCSSSPSSAIKISILGATETLLTTIFPNPTKDRFTVKTENSGELIIYNLSGIELLRKTITQTYDTIDISRYVPGNYIVKFTDHRLQTIITHLIKE